MSNRTVRAQVDLAEALVTRPTEGRSAYHQALCGARQPRIRDRVDMDEMVRKFANGAMIKDLAESYAIGESSVKRILRSRGVGRRWPASKHSP